MQIQKSDWERIEVARTVQDPQALTPRYSHPSEATERRPVPTLSARDPFDAGAGFENLSFFFSVMVPYLVTLRTRKYIYVIVVEILGREGFAMSYKPQSN